MIDKLRNGIDNFKPDFGGSSLPDSKNLKAYYLQRRGELVDQMADIRDRASRKLTKELCLRILYLNKQMAKQRRTYEQENTRRLALLNTAEIRDPMYVWTQLRLRIVNWLFEIFCRSRDESMKFKK